MDIFGIGAALKGCFSTYLQSARGTGRSSSMYNSLKNGDRVICLNHRDASEVEKQCRARGLEVETLTVSVERMDVHGLGTSQGRTVFDHRFVEAFHEKSIDESINHLDCIEKHLSGFDHRHIETKMKAMELSKWDSYR